MVPAVLLVYNTTFLSVTNEYRHQTDIQNDKERKVFGLAKSKARS
jgi:hypothetical protein